MKQSALLDPYESRRRIGRVCEVYPNAVLVTLPLLMQKDNPSYFGFPFNVGFVGGFAVIDCGELAVFGRVLNVVLPEKERYSLEQSAKEKTDYHPIGKIQLLTTIDLSGKKIIKGIPKYPKVGSFVYAAHPSYVKFIAETLDASTAQENAVSMQLATLPNSSDISISLSPEVLLGRHCAILGATGGGKSWTLGRIAEEVAKHRSKAILIDATGEFSTLRQRSKHVHLGTGPSITRNSQEVSMPHSSLHEVDLLAMFRPSGQTQAPKLRAAMKSLKLAKLVPALANANGNVVKAGQNRSTFETAYAAHIRAIDDPKADFDIRTLSAQINEECVYPTDQRNALNWGNYVANEQSYCVSMMARISDIITSPNLACIFSPGTVPSLFSTIDSFIRYNRYRLLVISLKHLSFAYSTRELVANAIARNLLERGRNAAFLKKPLVVFLDEAHQFLDKSLGDENNRYPLDQFELIAKEGRKYSLNLCMATQRPRDIPEGVLSQMGTLIVHRLINDKDREVVERAAGEIDRSAAEFLPSLSPGQAAVIGVDFPIPITLDILPPVQHPLSHGADFQKNWKLKK